MRDEIVFDIETQTGVLNDFKKLKVSCVSVYQYKTDTYQSFEEHELPKLWPIFEKADLIIGYNTKHFDIPVLNNYYLGDLSKLPHFDIMEQVKESLGFRLKLKDLAAATLDNIEKSADGLQAVRWWKEGKIAEIKKYCEQDVLVTKEIYDFGKQNHQLFYKSLTGEVLPFRVNFESNSADTAKKNINLTLPL
ncbi:MAG: ribonuclease H-like domain-containing protein [Patescibacteria group bacterium]